MKRVGSLLACALVAAVGITSLAIADGDPVGDTRGDNGGGGINRDLKGATHGHKGKRLKHGVSVYGKEIDTADLNLFINTNKNAAPDYVVNEVDGVVAVRRAATGQVTGRVQVVQVSEVKLRLLFKPAAIGKPKAYGWYVAFLSNKGEVYDRAPNAGYDKHRLVKR
jgi:hypothetical protein